jgi:hypothetical protein
MYLVCLSHPVMVLRLLAILLAPLCTLYPLTLLHLCYPLPQSRVPDALALPYVSTNSYYSSLGLPVPQRTLNGYSENNLEDIQRACSLFTEKGGNNMGCDSHT